MKKVTIDGVAYTLTDEAIEVNGYTIDENTTCNACYGEIIEHCDICGYRHLLDHPCPPKE